MNDLFDLSKSQELWGPFDFLLVAAIALACLLIVAWTYQLTHRGTSYAQSYVHALFLMGLCTAIVMMIIGSNIARAFSLVGALSIIRFRTAVKDVRDTAFLFFAIVVGMGAGTGFYWHTVVFTLVAAAVMILLSVFKFAERKVNEEVLKVTVKRDSAARTAVEAFLTKSFDEFRLINNVRLFDDDAETMIYVVRARRGLDPRKVADGLGAIPDVRGSAFYLGDQQVML